jgi:hypothetical protein
VFKKVTDSLAGITILFLLSACSFNVGAPPRFAWRLSSGKEITVVKRETIYFNDGPPALRLTYETSIPISDRVKLREEAYEIWTDYKSIVEKEGLTRAALSAVEPSTGSLVEHIRGYNFTFEKLANGEWKEHVKAE